MIEAEEEWEKSEIIRKAAIQLEAAEKEQKKKGKINTTQFKKGIII